jgi:predicted nucleic acid-binding protein
MAALVIDASVALAWGLPDEISAYADAALAAVEHGEMHIPDLWPHEVANGLAIAYLRQRITADDERLFLSALSRLSIHSDHPDPLAIIQQGTASAARFGLTAYDAAYLDLALRKNLPLVTVDRRMQEAARQAGVAIFQP